MKRVLLLKKRKTTDLREAAQEQTARGKVCHLRFLWASLLLGSNWQEKVSAIRSQMQKHHNAPTAVLLSSLDETACEYRSADMGGRLGPPSPLGPTAQVTSPNHHILSSSESSMTVAYGN